VASISSNAIPVPPAAPSRRIWWGFGVLILLAIAASIIWHNGLKNQFFPKNFGIVEPGKIYRSGQISARLIEPTLQRYNIQSIVALADTGMKPADREAEEQTAANLKIQRAVFPLSGDGTGRRFERHSVPYARTANAGIRCQLRRCGEHGG